jgi:hypothetical protein
MTDSIKLIYTAQSKQFFYCRDAICGFVLLKGYVPLNPFRMFDYFLGERIDRDIIRSANNTVIEKVDEIWVFGEEIANGVYNEILLAKKLNKPVKFFTVSPIMSEISIVLTEALTFEPELLHAYNDDREYLISQIFTEKA